MSPRTAIPPPSAELRGVVSHRRIMFLLIALLGLLALVATRTIYLQSVKNRTLQKLARGQQQNTQQLPAVRGDILDRKGRELAVGEEAVTFYATPKLVKNPASTAIAAAKILGMTHAEEEQLVERLTNATGGFAYVSRQVPRAKAERLEEAKLPGINWYPEERRMYPARSVAGQLLGRVGIDGEGLDGVELLYDHSLTGRPGTQVTVRDPAGIPIDVLKLQREQDGRDVRLTIDRVLQQEAERVLLKTKRRFGAESASAIVMNPRTGEILVNASVPGVNPVNWARASAMARNNRVISSTYEPGSTFKIVTISAALEEGLVTPATRLNLPYELKFCNEKDTCTVKESHVRGPVNLSVREILEQSSNIGTIRLAQRVRNAGGGNKAVNDWIKRFGFGAPTGVDFPGEEQGQVIPTSKWSDVSIGNIPIGQGIAVTPIQLASAYAAIANDGILEQPHLLQRIGDEPATRYPGRRILSARTAATMRSMFSGVVESDAGTGQKAKIDGYKVGGKTGTANVAGPNGYIKGEYNASFVGFVPVNNPQLVTLVVVNKPTNGYYGGDVAAPAFEEITQAALNYLAIPPDGVM